MNFETPRDMPMVIASRNCHHFSMYSMNDLEIKKIGVCTVVLIGGSADVCSGGCRFLVERYLEHSLDAHMYVNSYTF